MKIISARIQNYRSIVESNIVDLEERLTVLVGQNEQGKTTFLKVLNSGRRRNAPAHSSSL